MISESKKEEMEDVQITIQKLVTYFVERYVEEDMAIKQPKYILEDDFYDKEDFFKKISAYCNFD